MSVTNQPVDNLDKSKALWRAAYILVKKLDAVYHSDKAIKTVFSYEAYGNRLRLKELLQKLMFMDLSANFRRTEELIWRKAFYEPYFLYKIYVKNNEQQDRVTVFEETLVVHILSAIGYYQSLVLFLQTDLGGKQPYDFCTWFPIPLHIPLYCGIFFEFEEKSTPMENKSAANKLIHKCLTNIGDLFRYLIDFGDCNAGRLAYRYYKAALYFDPLIGLPHNQLGILDVGRCYGLNAVFHYLRCLTSRFPFEGAKRNLFTVLSKNELRYGRIVREKSCRSSRIRYASYFRSRDPAIENIFHDILAELHSSLLLTDHLTLKSKSTIFSESTCHINLGSTEVQQEKQGRIDETSDQLTGPIFIRMLLISILTYEYTRRIKMEQDLSRSGEKVDEILSMRRHSSQDTEITGDSTSLKTGDEEKVIQYETSSVPDLYEPLSFVLSMGELFVTHVCRQIYHRMGRFMEEPRRIPLNSSITVNSDNLCTKCTACSDLRTPSENVNCNHVLNRQLLVGNASLIKHPETILDDGNPDDELEDSNGIQPTRTSSHESIHSNTDNGEDDEDNVRLRFRRYSSDDDSEHDFLERPTDENDNESDTDFWGSDDSSLLHSQDEINSTGTPSDDDSDVFSDDRLRRASKLNRLGSQQNVKQSNHSSSKYLSESRSLNKDVKCSLTCISEEEMVQENKTENIKVPSRISPPTPNNDKELPNHYNSTTESIEKNIYYSPKGHSDSIKEDFSGPDVQFDKDSYDPNTDITTRISLFSRLYLFSAIKLFLDWLSSSQFQHINLSFQNTNFTSVDDGNIKSQESSRASILWQASVERFVSQLMPLLNSIYPIFDHLSHEILCKNITNISRSDTGQCDQKQHLHLDSCSHFFDANTNDVTSFNIVQQLSPDTCRAVEKLLFQQISCSSNLPSEAQNASEENSASETVIHNNNNNQNNDEFRIYPLPEDWLLLGLPSMNCIHDKIDFHNACLPPSLTEIDKTVLRCISLAFHGFSLASHSDRLALCITYNSTGNGHRPFNCNIPLSDISDVPSSCHSNWPYSNRRRHRGRRYQKFYPGYGRCDRYNSSCFNTNLNCNRNDHRNPYTAHRGYSYREHGRYLGSTKGHKSYYDSRYCNSHPHQLDSHHNNWDATESVRTSGVSQSDVLESVSKNNPQKPDSSLLVTYDPKQFNKTQSDSTETDQSRRDQAMRDMARLRLLNEVDQLARQFRNQSPLSSTRNTNASSCIQNSESTVNDKNLEFDINKSFLSPFLVIDAYCLTSHLSMVKQLVNSHRFILIIPQSVISHLDYLKKTVASARVAIRYLEHEAHSGNRYLRLQRPDEQPTRPIQLRRQGAMQSDARDLGTDIEEDELKGTSNHSLNLRVVRRWLSILDCASYFAETLKDSNKSSDATSSVSKTSIPQQTTSSDKLDTDASLYLLNISPPYWDLLSSECSTNESNELSTTKTAPVTILIGFRNTAPEDTIVPREFLKLAVNHGLNSYLNMSSSLACFVYGRQ
ncbi:Protein SMG5 [Schistosoma japonicum]|nr:Protein SMG5 [Schistosoma japonicum]